MSRRILNATALRWARVGYKRINPVLFLGLLAATILKSSAVTVAPVTVGPANAVSLPSSARFSLWIGDAPDDGSMQTLNPPVFKWIYYRDPWSIGYPNGTIQTFRFQLTTNNWVTTNWDIITSNNFYNCVGPITNADGSNWTGSNWWRIGYMDASATPSSLIWGFTNSFTMSPSATVWDRSMYGNLDYLLSIGTNHPHMFFNASNRAAMAAFLHTNSIMGFSWLQTTQQAYQAITSKWWNNDSVTNADPTTYFGLVANVCLAYQIDNNSPVWKAANPGQMVSRLTSGMIAHNYDMIDQNAIGEESKLIPICYDWAYDDMTANQRSNVVWGMEQFCKFFMYNDWWFAGTAPSPDRTYTNTLKIFHWSSAKLGSSHPFVDSGDGLFMTWSCMGESALMRDFQTYFLNYNLGQFEPFHNDFGRGYAEQAFRTYHNFAAQLLLACQDPRMTNNPWFTEYPKMLAYWEPLNFCELEDQFGDFGMSPNNGRPGTQLYNYKYYDLAIMHQDGHLYQQFLRNYSIRSGAPDFYPTTGEAFLPFYFNDTSPAQSDWPDTYYFNERDGWCMSYSYPPNNWKCFTNGVGFVLSARPAGTRVDHASFHDGAIQIFAYGADVTCGGIGEYWKHPIFYPGLFVDGIGDSMPYASNPTADWYARFTAFTNTSDFTFASADLSHAFNNLNTNGSAGSGNENLEAAYNYPTNDRPYVVSVTRNVLFPHKEYVVLYDTFQTTSNATFQWKWNIMETNNVTADTNNCAFTYTSTNFFNGSNVTTYVKHIVDPSLMSMMYLVGTNYAVKNPFTGEDFSSSITQTGEQKWNATVWIYNKTKTTNWHFLTVVFPVKWGQPAPTITRIDDNNVRVQQGAIDDTISVDPSTSPPTFTLNLSGPSLGPTHLSPPSDLRVAP